MTITDQLINQAVLKATIKRNEHRAAVLNRNRALDVKMDRQKHLYDLDNNNSAVRDYAEAEANLQIAIIAADETKTAADTSMRELIKLQLMIRAQGGDHLAQRAVENMIEDEKPKTFKKHQMPEGA